jgi:lipid A 3-O-deacylase
MKLLIYIMLPLLLVLAPGFPSAQEASQNLLVTAKNHLTLSAGYGEAIPGFGATKVRVRDADFILRYGHYLTDEMGESWYKGRHSVLVEVPFYYVTNPKASTMTGLNLLACWDFTNISKKVVPYIFAGGGAVYISSSLPEMGSKINANYQAGGGLHYFLSREIAIDINARYHHISNISTSSPNMPLNSVKGTIGISHFW